MRDYDKNPLILNAYDSILERKIFYVWIISFVVGLIGCVYIHNYLIDENSQYKNSFLLISFIGQIVFGLVVCSGVFVSERFGYGDTKVVFKQYTIEFYEKNKLRRISERYHIRKYIARPFFARYGFLKINFINSILLVIIIAFIMYLTNPYSVAFLLFEFLIFSFLYKFLIFMAISNDKFLLIFLLFI